MGCEDLHWNSAHEGDKEGMKVDARREHFI